MTRNVVRRIGIAAAAFAACEAQANAGIGLLVLAVPVTIVALVPAIMVEAPILARMLTLSAGRAVGISAAANIVSTIAGAAIAIATAFIPLMYGEFMRETVLISLVPMFFVTWWIENLVVRRMLPAESKARSTRATGIANAVSYVAMAVGVAILVPPERSMFNRWRVTPAVLELTVAKTEVDEYFASHGTFPAPKSFPAQDKSVKSLALEADGRLVATLSFPGRPAGDGRHIVYEPVVVGGKITAWKCTSDIESKYLPAQCR
jgi:hypothetical protein